jgi:hypothetical protein
VGLWRVFNIGTRSARTEHSNSNIHFWQAQVRPVVSLWLTSLSGSAPATCLARISPLASATRWRGNARKSGPAIGVATRRHRAAGHGPPHAQRPVVCLCNHHLPLRIAAGETGGRSLHGPVAALDEASVLLRCRSRPRRSCIFSAPGSPIGSPRTGPVRGGCRRRFLKQAPSWHFLGPHRALARDCRDPQLDRRQGSGRSALQSAGRFVSEASGR